MDKVKQILSVLKKYHFWILCGIVALVGLIVWSSASGKLDAQFKKDSANITQTLTGLSKIQTPHPNDTWTEGVGKKTDALRKQVKDVWEELYNSQKKNVFIWPQSLGKEFVDAATALDANPDQKLPDKLRERYQNMVKHEAAQLAEIVDAKPIDENARKDHSGQEGPQVDESEHKVHWTQLGDIQSTFDMEEAPSTQLIKYMQEELWVYEALCRVIKDVNAGSTSRRDAPVTDIAEMAIAYPAATEAVNGTKGRIMHKAGASGGEAGGTPEAAKAPPDPKTRGKEEGHAPAEDANDPDAMWKNYRYVKDTGEPMMAADIAGGSPEYNLMPFRLLLSINPRDIDRFLLACRNSTLPIEVKQVRINPNGGTAQALTGGSQHDAGSTQPKHAERVEISGVVYLIKPPDLSKLGITPGSESTEAPAGETPAAAPTQPPAGG